MTQKTFNILEFCSTWIKSSNFGIFQDVSIRSILENVPEEDGVILSGMWLYCIANGVNSIAVNLGYVADKAINIGPHTYVYLYRLE